MGVIDKFKNIGSNLWSIGSGVGRVMGGDWTGFQSIHSGVTGLFSEKDAMDAIKGYK